MSYVLKYEMAKAVATPNIYFFVFGKLICLVCICIWQTHQPGVYLHLAKSSAGRQIYICIWQIHLLGVYVYLANSSGGPVCVFGKLICRACICIWQTHLSGVYLYLANSSARRVPEEFPFPLSLTAADRQCAVSLLCRASADRQCAVRFIAVQGFC